MGAQSGDYQHIALGVTVGETTVLTSVLVDDRDVVADEFAGAGLIRRRRRPVLLATPQYLRHITLFFSKTCRFRRKDRQ